MSTFYGGPQLSSITRLYVTDSTASYTVPSGYYAVARVTLFSQNGTGEVAWLKLNTYFLETLTASSGVENTQTRELFLAAGDAISIFADSNVPLSIFVNAHAVIQVYKVP